MLHETTYPRKAGRDIFHFTLEKLEKFKSNMAADLKKGSVILITAAQVLFEYKTTMDSYFCFCTKHSEARGAPIKHLIALLSCKIRDSITHAY